MAKIDEIHSDVKVLQSQMETLVEIIKPVSDLARVVAVHQERWDHLNNEILPPIKDEVESFKKWKYGGAVMAPVVTAFHHLYLNVFGLWK